MSHILEFLDLVDVPNTFSGFPDRPVKVNAGATALEFGDIPALYVEVDDGSFTGAFSTASPAIDDTQAMADFLDFSLGHVFSFWNGVFAETFNALVTESGGVVTLSVEQAGGSGGDLTMHFSDGQTTLDCTPAATIVLTAGTDPSPTTNYIYILQSTKVLTKSTTQWPSTEHIKVAYLLVPSAVLVSSDGAYINQNWNDHTSGTDNQGHLTHITETIRLTMGGANWHSGVAGNATAGAYIEISGATPSVVEFKSTAGVAYQMHKHTVPAIDMSAGDDCHVVNWNGDAYHVITDLASIIADSTGTSLSNRFFNLVFWGVANKTGEHAPLMCNLPTGSYVGAANAIIDADGYDVTNIPDEFIRQSTTGFLICRLTCKQTPAGVWTLENTTDLRGAVVGAAAGAGSTGAAVTDFADNQFTLFNVSDATKIVDFDLSTLTTGNTRTITPADADMTLLSTADYGTLTSAGDADSLHTHAHAIHDNVANEITAISATNNLQNTDEFLIEDASDSFVKKAITWATLQAQLESDLGGPWLPLTGGNLTGDLYLDKTSDPTLFLREAGSAVNYSSITNVQSNLLTIQHLTAAAASFIRLDPMVGDGTSDAYIQLFRETNTTGAPSLIMYEGDNTSTIHHEFFTGDSGDVNLCKQGGSLSEGGNDVLTEGAAEISALTEKTTPVSADLIVIEDSAASNAKKRVQIGNLPSGGGGIPSTTGGTLYDMNTGPENVGTIPTWTTQVTHTLSDDFCYISEFWNDSIIASYAYAWYWQILVGGTVIIDSYNDDWGGNPFGRCWPEPYSTGIQWMPIGMESWTMFTHPIWAGDDVIIKSSPIVADNNGYFQAQIRIIDVALL